MQLATSQRPHPPPVPPRPSRQVVAEALKRTARPPPCPTRQAPPPPNTRPWRSEEQEKSGGPRPGRTVIYESGRAELQQTNGGQQVRCSSEPPRCLNELQRPLASPRCCNDETVAYGGGNNITGTTAALAEKTEVRNGGSGGGGGGGGSTRVTSERNEAENQRERHQQQHQQQQQQQQQQPSPLRRRSNGNVRCDRENSTIQLSEADSEILKKVDRRSISDDNVLAHKATENYSFVTNLFERKIEAGREAKDEGIFEVKKKRLLDKLKSWSSDETSKSSEPRDKRLLDDGSVNENIAKSTVVEKTEIRNEDRGRSQRRSSSFGNKAYSQVEATSGTRRLSTTPTKIEAKSKANVNSDRDKVVDDAWYDDADPISRQIQENAAVSSSALATSPSTAATISSDDCATVVVIDEPERKIAFSDDNDNIHHQDWLEAGIRYSSTKITLPGDDPVDRADEFTSPDDNLHNHNDEEHDDDPPTYAKLDYSSIRERIAMSSLQGLPPLPRSLSGFNLSEGRREAAEPPPPPTRSSSKTQKNVKSTQPSSSRPSPPGRQLTTLDTQLAILRKEMFGLRQLDLSLLSQLWSLNESIQEFRQLLQEQEDRAPSPSPSSEEGDDNSYGSHPPPPPRRPAPLLHHHRPPRPPRPLRPPASDESPSSEEYGAV